MFRNSDRDQREVIMDSLNRTRIANGLDAHYRPLVRNEVLGLLALLMFIALLTLATT